MSNGRVEGILRGYEAVNRGDMELLAEGLAPDFELQPPPILPESGTYRGPEGLKRFLETWRDSFDDFRIEIEEVIDAGDAVVVMAAVRGRGKDSGVEVRSPSFPHIWRFDGDRVVGMYALPTRAAAVEALALAD